MILSILIPTYNRSIYLEKNLKILKNHIDKLKESRNIEIVISNNCSPDDTNEMIKDFIENNPTLNINYFLQQENIGLEKNALAVLKQGKGEYVMYLGDDDYIDISYLKGVIQEIKNHKEVHCIIPSIVAVNLAGKQIKGGRDLKKSSTSYNAGFKNCLENSWRGHQLSGLVLKRENLYQTYIDRKVENIYLFIFFVAYSCLNGETYHFTDYPVKVTAASQENKDWNYGKDGLLNEIFDNFNKLPVNYFRKSILQLHFFKKQSWRLWGYRKKNLKEFIKAFFLVWFAPNGTFIFKVFFPFQFLGIYLINKIKLSFLK